VEPRPTSAHKRVTTSISERLPVDRLAWLKAFSVVMHRRYAHPTMHDHDALRVTEEEFDIASRTMDSRSMKTSMTPMKKAPM